MGEREAMGKRIAVELGLEEELIYSNDEAAGPTC